MASVQFEDNSRQAQDHFAKLIGANMERMQDEYAGDLSDKLSTPPARTGRIYTIDGKHHQASASDEPPAPLTGELRDSPTPVTVSIDRRKWDGAVVTDRDYAAILELGGVNGAGARIEPRPAWLVTIIENRKKYYETATEGFKKG